MLQVSYTTLTELFEAVKSLVAEDMHPEALSVIDDALTQSNWSEPEIRAVENKKEQVKNDQAARFQGLLQDLNVYFRGDQLHPVGTEEEMNRVEEKLARLQRIDTLRTSSDLHRQVGQLRKFSEAEWEYQRIRSKVEGALNTAQQELARTVGSGSLKPLEIAKTAITQLRSTTIPFWEDEARKPDSARANRLVTKLRDLLAVAEAEYQTMAQDSNILTTQAGNVNFWAIEETYLRWTNPSREKDVRVTAPEKFPQMKWTDVLTRDKDGEDHYVRRYIPIGDPLDLRTWHDSFMTDAGTYAREKGVRDLRNAEQALKEGAPVRARKLIDTMLNGDPAEGLKPYFNLPADIARQAQDLLKSNELRVRLAQFDRAVERLKEADDLRTRNVQEAYKKYLAAMSEQLDLEDIARLFRNSILDSVLTELTGLLTRYRQEKRVDAELVKAWQSEVNQWLRLLPEYGNQAGLATRLDPESKLRPLRGMLLQFISYCDILLELVALDSKKSNLESEAIEISLQELRQEMTSSALAPTDFQLFQTLEAYAENERNAQKQVAAKLADTEIFAANPAATNVDRLTIEQAAARDSKHPEFRKLLQAFEAQYSLYREATEDLPIEARINLLQPVVDNQDVPLTIRKIAELRLSEAKHRKRVTEAFRTRISLAAALDKTSSRQEFAQAWERLDAVLDSDPSPKDELIQELQTAKRHFRENLLDAVNQYIAAYGATMELNKRDVEEVRAWLELTKKVAAYEAEITLRRAFELGIQKWEAVNSDDQWTRFAAACALAAHDSTRTADGQRAARLAGLKWVIEEMERARNQLANTVSAQESTFAGREASAAALQEQIAEPEQLLERVPDVKLQDELRRSFGYMSKAIELYIWQERLSNARTLMLSLGSEDQPQLAGVLTRSALTELLELGELYGQIVGYLRTEREPDEDSVSQLNEGYNRLLNG